MKRPSSQAHGGDDRAAIELGDVSDASSAAPEDAAADERQMMEVELSSSNNPMLKASGHEDESVVSLYNRGDRGRDEERSSSGRVEEDKGWRKRFALKIELYLFDPRLPRETQLFRKENCCIVLCYVLVGLFQGVTSGVFNVYPLELGATEAQQTTIKVLKSAPASFKLVYGFISDARPIFGYRRKGYMGLGWATSSVAMFLLAVNKTPSIAFLSFMTLLFAFGFWFADVMADALVAERAKLEPEGAQGTLQSTCYAFRFFSLMVGVIASTFLYEAVGTHTIFAFLGLCPVVILALPWWWLEEDRYVEVSPVRDQCQEIWNTVSNRSVFQPMGFVYLYNVVQLGNAAWTQYMYTVLEFSTKQINGILVASEILLFVGVMSYKEFMREWSWRSVYVVCITLNCIFSALQIMLIFGINRSIGIPDFAFALGDEGMMEFISGVQFLPTTIMMVHLCPKGSEGVSYAMFTTMNNVALILSSNLSTLLLAIWDVSEENLAKGNLDGFVKLTILTTCLQTCGGLFLPMLPKYKSDLADLKAERSDLGGAVFLGIIFVSLLWSLISSFLSIFAPGWAGES